MSGGDQTLTPAQALQLALARHRQGDVVGAAQLYRQILVLTPRQPDALHLLGVACRQQGQLDEALQLLADAASVAPGNPDLRANYGEALLAAGQPAAAEAQLRAGLKLVAHHPQLLNNLGLALQAQGKTEQALAAGRKAVAAAPEHANARNNLGNTLMAAGRPQEALAEFAAASRLEPGNPDIALNLVLAHEACGDPHAALRLLQTAVSAHPGHARLHGTAGHLLWQQRRPAEARPLFERALQLKADDAGHWTNYGLTLHDLGEADAAIAAFQRAIALQPQEPGHWCNLGITLKAVGRIGDAIDAYRQALGQRPDHANSWSNLGMALEAAGRADEAVAAYARAEEFNPALDRAASNRLFALNYLPEQHPEAAPARIAAAHRQWAAQHVARLYPSVPPAPRRRAEGERLRLGLISPDLRSHPVAWLLLPYLRHYDRQRIELFVYADLGRQDDITATCRELAEHWRETGSDSHAGLAERIRADGIDLLIDLAGHTDRHRLPVFAMRPAPRQASWIGYFNTTGLATIDGFVTDPHTTPTAWAPYFSEQLWQLPVTRFCYEPPPYCPAVAPPPLLTHGRLTFGSFNNLAKLNDEVAATWAALLAQVPDSRLLLKTLALDDAGVRADWQQRFARHFAAHGVDPARLELRGYSLHPQMLAEYGEVDIALDPFPFGGGMTSCEALWMGVPVLTLAGNTVAGRQTHSLLHALDLPEWSTGSRAEYIDRGAALAQAFLARPDSLSQLRTTLRPRFATSPAGDAPAFARAVDALWWQATGQ